MTAAMCGVVFILNGLALLTSARSTNAAEGSAGALSRITFILGGAAAIFGTGLLIGIR